MQAERTAKTDIFEIEGVGPLAIASTWPTLVEGRPWIHFIDRQGAQMTLVRKSGNSQRRRHLRLDMERRAGYPVVALARTSHEQEQPH